MSRLVDFLLSGGYQQISLSRNGVGHFETAGSVAGMPISILVDTGAASTLLDISAARRAGLALTLLSATGGGAGGASLPIYHVPSGELLLGKLKPRYSALMAMDLTHVNQALKMKGAKPVDAILGVDVFEAHGAVIDYDSRSLFLRA